MRTRESSKKQHSKLYIKREINLISRLYKCILKCFHTANESGYWFIKEWQLSQSCLNCITALGIYSSQKGKFVKRKWKRSDAHNQIFQPVPCCGCAHDLNDCYFHSLVKIMEFKRLKRWKVVYLPLMPHFLTSN